jgi:ribosomal protein S18 acetylase RimI-like enzyme
MTLGSLNMQPSIRLLGVEDASALIDLRQEALKTEPLAFAASPQDDVALKIDSVLGFLASGDTQAVYGAFDGEMLVAMVGLVRATKLKQRHKAMLWGMYVQPRLRRTGVGRALLNAAIDHARSWCVDQLQLSVAETGTAAKHLYEAAGFRIWGTEPHALHWHGRSVMEHHLVLSLSTSA